mmetsp:Transcript_41155/g.96763  ORF Transcript_41155/g.96763 Transcript_41155/m.96763 type:complete len:391 (+) Transcript_41155:668-1840(+)
MACIRARRRVPHGRHRAGAIQLQGGRSADRGCAGGALRRRLHAHRQHREPAGTHQREAADPGPAGGGEAGGCAVPVRDDVGAVPRVRAHGRHARRLGAPARGRPRAPQAPARRPRDQDRLPRRVPARAVVLAGPRPVPGAGPDELRPRHAALALHAPAEHVRRHRLPRRHVQALQGASEGGVRGAGNAVSPRLRLPLQTLQARPGRGAAASVAAEWSVGGGGGGHGRASGQVRQDGGVRRSHTERSRPLQPVGQPAAISASACALAPARRHLQERRGAPAFLGQPELSVPVRLLLLDARRRRPRPRNLPQRLPDPGLARPRRGRFGRVRAGQGCERGGDVRVRQGQLEPRGLQVLVDLCSDRGALRRARRPVRVDHVLAPHQGVVADQGR